MLEILSTVCFGEYIDAIKQVNIALGIDDCINKTPAPYPDKLKIFIKAYPTIGPSITLPIDDIIELLTEKTFNWVNEIPSDININTIIVQPNSITLFNTNLGISKSQYKKNTEIITA